MTYNPADLSAGRGAVADSGSTVAADRCYCLPKQVYACRTDDGVVFLDAARDRYFGLGGAGVMALPEFVDNWPSGNLGIRGVDQTPRAGAEVQRVADSLIERGLLRQGREEATLTARTAVPALALDLPGEAIEADRALRPADWLYFALSCIQAVWYLKRLPLAAIAARVTAARRTEAPAEQAPVDLVDVFGRVQVFRRLRRLFFSEKNRCLLNALALVFFLRRYGYFPHFVIGVKTRPFGAHSWVQHEQFLLEGDPASVCHFVPILVA